MSRVHPPRPPPPTDSPLPPDGPPGRPRLLRCTGRRQGARRPAALLTGAVLLVAPAWPAAGAPPRGRSAPAAPPQAQEAGPTVVYAPPVDGPVVAGFERPSRPWQAGHRGVDLAARPGQVVRAAGDGTVVFAGSVAGRRWVTVAHRDGVRTSYGPLARVTVARGQTLVRGAPLGTVEAGHGLSGAALHWSARDDGGYTDPRALLEAVGWRPTLVGPGGWTITGAPDVPRYDDWQGRADGLAGKLGLVEGSPVADGPGWLLAPNPNHVVGMAGLGSASPPVGCETKDAGDRCRNRPLDLTHLGYAPGNITYLSYAGRHDRAGDPNDPRRDQLPYEPAHTSAGLRAAARRLDAQLRAQWARRPDQAVDLVGHSMGGAVIAYYLLTMYDPSDPRLPPVDHVATIASPLEGADAANGVREAAENPAVALLLEGIAARGGVVRPQDPSVTDLAVGSPALGALQAAWTKARRAPYASPLANGTELATFGAQWDVLVPEHRSDLPGAAHAVLPGGHSRVRDTEASRIALRAFLANEPVPGAAGGLGHLASYAIGWSEQMVGDAVGELVPPGVPPTAEEPIPGLVVDDVEW